MSQVTVEWKPASETPDVPKGHARCFIVAVRRKHDGNIYRFPACYLNGMQLMWDDDRQGNVEDEDEGAGTTGWYTEKDHADYDTAYYELLGGSDCEGDELVAWCALPPLPLPSEENMARVAWTRAHAQESAE